MEYIVLEELTDDRVAYRYYPEGGSEYGVVSLMRKTGELIHDKPCPDSIFMYVEHAWQRLEEYQEKGNFPEKGMIAWY